MKVLVTGNDGQLGSCIRVLEDRCYNIDFSFTNSKKLDITQKEDIEIYFQNNNFDYVINCAAYTNVEKAEKELQKAFLVNAEGAQNLAEICNKYSIVLLHISTDYVFDGESKIPYCEDDYTNPINEYGKSKLKGEEFIQKITRKHFIIRTSWLYSKFGKNFYETILKKSDIQEKLTITTSELGTPTNANDLASFLLHIIKTESEKYGIYHFSNLGSATWYDFAEEILKISGKLGKINLEKTDNYSTFAQRPKYSVLSKEKAMKNFGIEIFTWQESLKELMTK